MSSSIEKSSRALSILNGVQDVGQLIAKIKSKSYQPIDGDLLPTETATTAETQQNLLTILNSKAGFSPEYLTGKKNFSDFEALKGNIENYIGMTQVPTGVIGPLRVIGSNADGNFYIPMATSEGALIASYQRGAKATRLCGGVTSVCLVEAVQRSPVFKFNDMGDLGIFLVWILQQFEEFKTITRKSSNYANLVDVRSNIEGNQLILTFEFHTGDAAGQNMVTFCTDEICTYIFDNAPLQPIAWFIESNYSGDKKATALSFTRVRGRKVTAEAHLDRETVTKVLKTTPEAIAEYWQASTVGIIQSGALGAQGHFANGLAALYLACGQDVACVSESAVGVTRMQITGDDKLYVSVTLPSLIVGTIGGGTALPTQKECLSLMQCSGEGTARKFAEICGAVILCGEISIAAALSAGHFARAHKHLGRKK